MGGAQGQEVGWPQVPRAPSGRAVYPFDRLRTGLDFYCPARKLVVEMDGEVHEEDEQAVYDEGRTEQLNDYGYRVIRFRNEEVLEDLPAVLERLLEAAEDSPP